MIKKFFLFLFVIVFATSCVSSKKFKKSQADLRETELNLTKATVELQKCKEDLSKLESRTNDEIGSMRKMNTELVAKIGDLTSLSRQEAENLQASLQKIREKDLQITSLNEALTRKDSVTIALVTSLKSAIGINDKDIEISVEKGVVFISISDKFLFKSGSYAINMQAKEVLSKVAKVLNSKPELEVLIEGHTDTNPFSRAPLQDNWDLSVKRATSLVRTLQTEFNVAPHRMIAAGRGEYVPVVENTSAEGRARNRRTRVILLPKLEEFASLISDGMKK